MDRYKTIRCPCCNACLFCYFKRRDKKTPTVYITQNKGRDFYWRCEKCGNEEQSPRFNKSKIQTQKVGSGQEWVNEDQG